MASINGVEVKNVKELKNNAFEWGSILTGVVYLNGKKLGEWSQDPHGAVCDNFDPGVEKALQPAVLGVRSIKKGVEADIYDASCLITDIIMLNDREKRYKGYLTKGYPVVLVGIEKSTGIEVYQAYKEGSYITEKRKEEFALEFLRTLQGKGYQNSSLENIELTVYRSLDDFKQTIGTKESIKKEVIKQEKEKKAAQKKAADEKLRTEKIEKDREKRNNGRFVATQVDGDPSMYIADTKTGRKVQVPLYAFKETYNAIIDLIC